VKAGQFREDLYYRLAVIPLVVPSLAERRSDIPLLAAHFVQVCAERNRKEVRGITDEALTALSGWSWPGNVRELENVIERAVVLCRSDRVDVIDLPAHVRPSASPPGRELTFAIGTPLREVERTVILETLRHTQGDKKFAAHLLGIAARTIYRRLSEERGGNDDDASLDDVEGGS
jgi:two-component system response regulator HydG